MLWQAPGGKIASLYGCRAMGRAAHAFESSKRWFLDSNVGIEPESLKSSCYLPGYRDFVRALALSATDKHSRVEF